MAKVVSIEIGAKQVHIAVLKLFGKKQRVRKALIFDTPENIVEDGYIMDSEAFAKVLRQEMKKAKIRNKKVVFTLASNKIITREVTVNAISQGKISKMVAMGTQDYFPMDISEHAVSYFVIGQDKEAKQSRLMLYAVPDDLIQNHYDLAKKMHRKVVSVDCVGNSLYQWLKRSSFEDISLILQMNMTNSTITLLNNKVMGIQRTVNYGIDTFAESVLDGGAFEHVATEEEALALLQDRPVFADAVAAEEKEHWQEDLLDAARMITSNVARVIEYYSTKNPGVAVQRIYITGVGATIPGLAEFLSEEVQIPVEIYNVTEGVKFKRRAKLLQQDGYKLFANFGAVVDPFGLRPFSLILRKKTFRSVAGIAVLCLMVIGAFGYVIWVTHGEIQEKERIRAELSGKIAEIENIELLEAGSVASEAALLAAKEADAQTLRESELLSKVIEDLEQVLPSRSVLYSLSFNDNTLMLNFATVTKEESAEVLMQLKALPYFGTVQVTGIVETVNTTTHLTEVAFTVNCSLIYEHGTETEVQTNE